MNRPPRKGDRVAIALWDGTEILGTVDNPKDRETHANWEQMGYFYVVLDQGGKVCVVRHLSGWRLAS